MPRLNYSPRKKTSVQKLTGLEIQQEQIDDFFRLLVERGEVKEWDAQRILGWGPGVYNKNKTILLGYYSEEVEWDKKTKTWINIPVEPKKDIGGWKSDEIEKPLEVKTIE